MTTKRFAVMLGILGSQLLAQSVLAQQEKTFEIKGHIKDIPENGRVLLYYLGGNKRFDTTRATHGVFHIKGSIEQPLKAMLFTEFITDDTTQKGHMRKQDLYIDPGTTTVTGADIAAAAISGGAAETDFSKLTGLWQSAGWKDGGKNTEDILLKKDSATLEFIQQYPASPVSAWALEELSKPHYIAGHQEKVKAVFQKMDTAWQHSKAGLDIAKMIETAGALGIGMPAIDFEAADPTGKPVKLSDFRGKYVLLDFWASWCVPCRGENPNVVKNYEKYKSKNFTILGVSLDDRAGKDKWIAAIQKDGLTWTQVSDLMGWKSQIARSYRVQSIPINYLIDPQGKIIAVGLRGEMLGETLEKLLGTTH